MKFDDGLKFERENFLALMQTPESKALRHVFFGERAASKIPDVPEDTPKRPIKSAAIIGAGTMGGGIAMNFANAGIPVTLLEMKQEALDKGLATVRKNYENTMKKGKLTQAKFDERVGLIKGTLSYDDIRNADIVIEAVFEEMGVKEKVFNKLDHVMKPGAILASNTSTLDLNKIAAFTKRPQDVIGTHFFSPANVMKLLEIVRGEKTAKDVLATTMALSKKIKKTGVVSGVCDGFIGNRMIEQYSRQAGFLLEEGCLPEQVDKAIEKFGFAMGPFRMGDMAGNDIGWAIRKRRYVERPDMKYSKTADLLCEMGRYGQKTGAGWYDYKPGDRKPYPSQLVNDMIIQHSKDTKVKRRKVERPGDRRAPGVLDGERSRAHPRRGHRATGLRHRHGLPDRLRFPAAPRRPDVLRRHRGPAQCGRGDEEIRQGPPRRVLEAGAAAGQARQEGKNVQLICPMSSAMDRAHCCSNASSLRGRRPVRADRRWCTDDEPVRAQSAILHKSKPRPLSLLTITAFSVRMRPLSVQKTRLARAPQEDLLRGAARKVFRGI